MEVVEGPILSTLVVFWAPLRPRLLSGAWKQFRVESGWPGVEPGACGMGVWGCKGMLHIVGDVCAKFGAWVYGVDLSRNGQAGSRVPGACWGMPGRLQRLEITGQLSHGVSDVEMSWEPGGLGVWRS